MKKGISIWSFKKASLADCFTMAKEAGFDGVEVAIDKNGEISLDSTKEEISAIKKMADQIGIELYSVANGLCWEYCYTSNDPENRKTAIEITKKQLQVAAWLDCDTILTIPGIVYSELNCNNEIVEYDIAYQRALYAYKQLAPYAEKLKINVGIENVWNQFLLSPIEFADFVDKIGSEYIGAYFDVGNVLYNGYPEHWIRILGNRIKKVHFKDYRRSVGGLDGFVDLLSGDVNFPQVMREFEKTGYDDWATAEIVPPYTYYSETTLLTASVAMDKILKISK